MIFNTYSANATTAFAWIEIRVVQRDPPLPDALVERVMLAVSELDIELPATLADLKAARRRLAKVHHPDAGGDEEAMKRINAAFDVLGEVTT